MRGGDGWIAGLLASCLAFSWYSSRKIKKEMKDSMTRSRLNEPYSHSISSKLEEPYGGRYK